MGETGVQDAASAAIVLHKMVQIMGAQPWTAFITSSVWALRAYASYLLLYVGNPVFPVRSRRNLKGSQRCSTCRPTWCA